MIGICFALHLPQMLLMQVIANACHIRALVPRRDWWRHHKVSTSESGQEHPTKAPRGFASPRVLKPSTLILTDITTNRTSDTDDRHPVTYNATYTSECRKKGRHCHHPETARPPADIPHARPIAHLFPKHHSRQLDLLWKPQGRIRFPSSVHLLGDRPGLRSNAPLNCRDPRGHSQVLSASHLGIFSLDTRQRTCDL